MDLVSALNDVKNLNEYTTVTEEYAIRSNKNLKVPLNTATVLALKKIRSIEIEYFNKRDENGIACTILENLLSTAPSKVWGLLAKELIHLLQYWLEAIRKHLINHSTHWWMFLSLLLKFIKEIYLKDPGIPDLLVEFTAECLFDLATAAKADVYQQHEILHCLNMVCAASSREVRFAFRSKFSDCFVKLASAMATSGYLPFQYSSLECLLRWLLPRQERSLRALSADKWFPRDLCPDTARALFLNSTWMNFLQDAREFLNALNEGNGLVMSFICRQLTMGQIVAINGTERQIAWLDFNTSVKCVSVLLDPRELEVFGVTGHRACEALLIDGEITETAVLRRESLGLTISLELHRPPSIRPSDARVTGRRVTALVSSRTDLRALDRAMRTTYGDKYQLLLDLDMEVSQSPHVSSGKNKTGNCSEEDTRFSHPVEVKRHKHAGYIVRTKYAEGINTPSTASTSSIIHLKDKLAALPRFPRFDKEPVSVVAEPSLSKVSERPEQDNNCGVKSAKSQRYKTFPKPPRVVISRSDGETVRPKNRGGRRLLSPVVSDDNATSLNFVATVGTDESVINETIERLSKSKEYDGDNIVDLLVREAMLAKPSIDVSDSGINTDEKKSQEESEAIDDTPNEIKEAKNRASYKTPCIISTTDDESNTEAINETPALECLKKNVRGRNKSSTTNIEEKQTFDVKTVEEFFSQHVAENQRGEIVISPSLAKKINETSSETSDNFDENYLLLNDEVHTDIEQSIFDEVAIIDCLNEMVDKVCRDFDNFTDNLFKKSITDIIQTNDHQDHSEISKAKNAAKPKPAPKAKNTKLKYKPVKKTKPATRAIKKSKAVEQNKTKKMSTIIEQKEEEMIQDTEEEHVEVVKIISPEKSETPKSKYKETPPIRRKRKLYSPKDDEIEIDMEHYNVEKTSDDVPLSKIKERDNSKPQSTAMCYKEIEKVRKKYTRLPRTRKSKGKVTEPPSPRTAKMNTVFDNLKETIESNENIKLANKSDNVYNFTSDSEDEDFKKKKIEINIRTSVEPKAKGKNTRRGKESDTSYDDTKKIKSVQRKKVTKRMNKQKVGEKVAVIDLVKIDLVDERMREAEREKLNTSIIVEHPTNLEPIELEPMLHELPQMEHIQENETIDTLITRERAKKTKRKFEIESNDTNKKIKETQPETHDSASNDTLISKNNVNKRPKKNKSVTVKKEKRVVKKDKTIVLPDNDDGTSSPLPGLLIEESKPKNKDDINDSLNANILQKFKKIYRDGPDVNDSVLTQNMLSDVDKFNFTAQNYINTTDEICFIDYDKDIPKRAKKQNTKAIPTKSIKNIAKKKIESATNETIEIEEMAPVHDIQSDKSIATDGITAHGDEDEVPPATESIEEIFKPRELQDLTQSMKDYFTKLTREIQDSSKSSVESKKLGKGRTEVDNTNVRSPVVSVKRLSFEDISKWMPSRRTSDTDSPQASPKNSAKKLSVTPSTAESCDENTPRVDTKTAEISAPVKTKSANTSAPVIILSPLPSKADLVKVKSPSVAIARISLEEFNKWLPPMPISKDDNISSPKKTRRELKLIYPTRSKSKVNDIEIKNVTRKEKSISKTAEFKPGETQTDTNDSDHIESYNAWNNRTRSRFTKRAASRKRQVIDSDTDKETTEESKNKEQTQRYTKPDSAKTTVKKKKSIISPIKLFEDFVPLLDIGESSNDENVTRNTNMVSKLKDSQTNKSKSNVSKADTPKSRVQLTPATPENRKRLCKSPILSVPKKKMIEPQTSFGEKITSEKSKTTFIEPKTLFHPMKKIEVLEDVTFTGSGPSSSSVNDWFRRTDAAIIDPSLSLRDTVQNVVEKLDTTLVEINQNTSKKFVNLFVEAQKELDLMSEQISKSQVMVESFKQKFKKQAFELIRADCQQRRAMVVLLKEDVQAVLQHMDEEKD